MNLSRKSKIVIAAIIGVVVALGICLSLITSSSVAPLKADASSLAGIKKAKWGKNVTVIYSSTKVRIKSNSIPNHGRDAQYAVPNGGIVVPDASTARIVSDPTKAHALDYSIPLVPVWSSKTTAAPLGSIGIMISGSVLFNPYEGDSKTIAMASNFHLTNSSGKNVWFVDSCSGHPTPSPGGLYHYHGLPACVASQVDTSTGPSHIIGIAFDGYPIYGERDINGKKVSLSSLDAFNGINSPTPEFPAGKYHYVLTSSVSAQSSIRCFHGKVDKSLITQMPNMGGGPPPGGGPPLASRISSKLVASLFCRLGSVA